MDLFENYDQQPKILSDILNQYDLENMTYKNCKEMLQKVNEIGYTFEYGLDAEPFNLHNIKTKEIETLNKKLIERLNETHRAIDSALETMDEMGLNLKESDFYQEIAAELAPNETLLKHIEKEEITKQLEEMDIGEMKSAIFRKGNLKSTKEYFKNTQDQFEINDMTDGWNIAIVNKTTMIGYLTGTVRHNELEWN